MQEIPTKIRDKYWIAEEHNLNLESTEREIQNTKIPVPYQISNSASKPENYGLSSHQIEGIYGPNYGEKSSPFKGVEIKPRKRKVKEFSMKLDTSSPRFFMGGSGSDNLNRRISELEEALTNEILKNEETQALNIALQEMIESVQDSAKFRGDEGTKSVKIGEILKSEKKGNSGVIESEQEMELKMELIEVKENLQKEQLRYRQLEEQILDLREINQQANKDLKFAIESVKHANHLEEKYEEMKKQCQRYEMRLKEMEDNEQEEQMNKHFDENELKEEFKRTIDTIKGKYETVIEELTEQNELKEKEFEQFKSRFARERDEMLSEVKDTMKWKNDFDKESKKEIEKLLNENLNLKKENDNLKNEVQDLKNNLENYSEREVRQIRELKKELEEKNEGIQSLIAQIEDQSQIEDQAGNRNNVEVVQLSKEIELIEEKMRKNNFQLRMVYTRVNYMLKRLTGRNFIDSSKIPFIFSQ